jgi:hypothetical protein
MELKYVNRPPIPDFQPFESSKKLRDAFENAGRGEKINVIDTEKFKMLPSKTDEGWQEAVNNSKSQLEYQSQRALNLELLAEDGSNQWKLANWELEEITKTMQVNIEEIEESIASINRQRKQDQV